MNTSTLREVFQGKKSQLTAKLLFPLFVAIMLLATQFLNAQPVTVQIGSGTTTTTYFPIYSCYGYNYSQQIYLASEINAGGGGPGTISKIRFYYNSGGATYANWTNWTVYLGNTTKASFSAANDWVAVGNMTQVFLGNIPTPVAGTWLEITLTTPFEYDGNNLVVAIDENSTGYSCTAAWRSFASGSNRGILYYSDGTNPNPASPPTANYGPNATLAQLQFDVQLPTCEGQPDAGTAAISNSTGCSGVNFTLSATGISTGLGIVYQWQSSPDGDNWSDISGATTSTYITSATSNTYYRLQTTCTPSSGVNHSNEVLYTVINNQCQCGSYTVFSATSDADEDLGNVTVGTLNNTSTMGQLAPGAGSVAFRYSNYTGAVAPPDLQQGSNVPFSLTSITSGSNYSNGFQIYIDYNQNGIFESAERMYSSPSSISGPHTETGSFLVPTDALLGITRMRVVCNEVTFPSATNFAATNYSWGETEDYCVNITEASGCAPISDLAYSNVQTESAQISWTASASDPANGYHIYYSTSSTAPGAGTSPTASVGYGTTSYNMFGLNPSTTYYVWVRANCGTGDYSSWSASISFTTLCGPSNVPYSQNFESVTVPALPLCTSVQNVGSGNLWATAQVSGNGFSSKVLQYTYNSSNAANVWFFTNGINLQAGTAYRLTFKYGNNSASYVEKLKVAYGNANDASAMTNILLDYPTINQATAQNASVDFTPPSSGVYYLGFQAYSAADQWNLYVDDILLELGPTCLLPSNLEYSNLTSSSATLNWTASISDPAEGYHIYYSTSSTNPDAETSPSASVGQGVTTYNITGLEEATTYYAWVRANCGDGDYSSWTSPVSFATTCSPADVPYVQDFETAVLPGLPVCTSIQNLGSGNNWITTDTDHGLGFSSQYLVYGYNSTYPANVWFFTQGVNLTEGVAYMISYMYGNDDGTDYPEKMKVAYGTAPAAASMTTILADHPNIVTSPNTNEVVFNPPSTGVYYFGFHAYSLADMDILSLDNILVQEAPSCNPPGNLQSSAVTENSATLSWSAALPAPTGGYDIYYSTVATAPIEETEPTASVEAGVTEYDMSGLNSSTTYYAWVRSNCGGDEYSNWTNSVSFTTPCGSVTSFPWTESFESVSVPAFPLCWYMQNGDWVTTNNGATTLDADARTGTQFLRETYSAVNEYMWTPGFMLTEGVSYDFSFWWAGDNYSGWTGDVFYNTDPNSTGASQLGTSFVTSGIVTSKTYQLVSRSFVPPTTGVYYFAIRVNATSAPWYLSFDDFRMEPTPTCFIPGNISFTNITNSTATINWQPASPPPSDGYDIYYSTLNTEPNSESIPSASVGEGITSYNASGLTAQTTYYVWVRSNCGGADITEWVGGNSFMTACDPQVLPWTENFDAMGAIGNSVVPDCWKVESTGTPWWSANAGSNTYNDPYSSPNYITCHWSPTSSDKYLITPGFYLTEGATYDFSFMWAGDNYTGWTGDVRYNTAQTGAGSTLLGTAFVTSGVTSPTTYVPVSRWFTPAVSGTYFFVIRVNSNSTPYWLGFDNFALTQVPECDGEPVAGTAALNPPLVCGGSSVTATLTGYSVELGVEFQWEQSVNGTDGWADVTGGTGANTVVYNTPALADIMYYRCKVTCSNTGDYSYSNVVMANIDPIVQTTLPWAESFENISAAGQWPCGWAFSSSTHCSTYTANQTYNRKPNTGTKYAAFRYSSSTAKWMYTKGFNLNAGQAYKFSFWYTTDGLAGWSNLRARYGTAQTAAAMTNVIEGATVTTPTGTTYQQVTGYFMPSSSGVYYIGVSVTDNNVPWYLSVDDFSLEEFDGCISMPTPGNASAVPPVICENSSSVITLNGYSTLDGVVLQWEQSADGSTGWASVAGGSGETTDVYTTAALDVTTYYRCAVTCTNTSQTAYSNVVMVGVNPNPAVTVSGANVICSGYTVTLTANITGGAGTLTRQWQKQVGQNWENVGTNSNTYVTEPIASTQNYRCVVNGSAGCVEAISEEHEISVDNDPIINVYGATTVCAGGQALLGVEATTVYGGTISYQWYYFINGVWKIIPGQTGNTFVANPPYTRNYRVRVISPNSPCSSTFGEVITVTVVPDPVVTTHPVGRNICIGGDHTMNVGVTGGLDNTYQWQTSPDLVSWHDIPQATAEEYQASNLQESSYFRCVVTGTDFGCAGDSYSNPAFVNVYPDPSITISGGTTYCVGGSTLLKSVVSGGCGTASYQWQEYTGNVWENIENATANQLWVSPTATTLYRCVYARVGQGCDDGISNEETVTVLSDPYFLQQPESDVVNAGDSYLLSVNVAGGMELSYQWQYLLNGIWRDIPGAVTDTYLAKPPATRSYRVRVYSTGLECNNVTSEVAVLTVTNQMTKAPVENDNLQADNDESNKVKNQMLTSMTLYPNPFSNELNIYLENCNAGPVVIEIYNLTGSLIQRWNLETETDSFFWQLNIGNWAPAMYLIRIENANQVLMKRAVKN